MEEIENILPETGSAKKREQVKYLMIYLQLEAVRN